MKMRQFSGWIVACVLLAGCKSMGGEVLHREGNPCQGVPTNCPEIPVVIDIDADNPGKTPAAIPPCADTASGGSLTMNIPFNSIVIFKDHTPLENGNFFIQGTGSAVAHRVKSVSGNRQCFHYMIVDLAEPTRPTRDPVIVIEPN